MNKNKKRDPEALMDNDCMLAALAYLAELPVSKVRADIFLNMDVAHGPYDLKTIITQASFYDMYFGVNLSASPKQSLLTNSEGVLEAHFDTTRKGRTALVLVRSVKDTLHAVVLEDGKLYDPSNPQRGRKSFNDYYVLGVFPVYMFADKEAVSSGDAYLEQQKGLNDGC